jgi:hypothetical protein
MKAYIKYLLRILPIVLLLEIILLVTGVLPANVTAVLIIVTEGTALILGGTLGFTLIKEIRAKVRQGHKAFAAMEEILKDALPPKILFVAKHEIGMLAGIMRLIRGKVDIPQGAITIKHSQQIRQLVMVLLVVSIIEIVAVELLVPWEIVRVVVLILSIYGLRWMIGFWASTIVYPHYVTDDELVLRFSYFHTITVPLGNVVGMSANNQSASENKTVTLGGDALALNVMGETNFRLEINDSTGVLHNMHTLQDQIRCIRFQTDDQKVAHSSITRKLSSTMGASTLPPNERCLMTRVVA